MKTMVDKYAVFGNPIAHSLSPKIHAQFAQQTAQEISYRAQRVELEQFEQTLKNFIQNGGKGLNITVPFKEQAYQSADKLSERAQRAAAVNTLICQLDGTLLGETTDGVGLVRDLSQNLGQTLKAKNILILGAGGAVRGVIEAISQHQPKQITIANRTAEKAEQLAKIFSTMAHIKGCGLNQIDQIYDLVINGTSASLQGKMLNLPSKLFKSNATAYDMMYSANATPFMQWASEHGASQIHDGLGMLVEQAAESFYLWRKVRPQTQQVIADLRHRLSDGLPKTNVD